MDSKQKIIENVMDSKEKTIQVIVCEDGKKLETTHRFALTTEISEFLKQYSTLATLIHTESKVEITKLVIPLLLTQRLSELKLPALQDKILIVGKTLGYWKVYSVFIQYEHATQAIVVEFFNDQTVLDIKKCLSVHTGCNTEGWVLRCNSLSSDDILHDNQHMETVLFAEQRHFRDCLPMHTIYASHPDLPQHELEQKFVVLNTQGIARKNKAKSSVDRSDCIYQIHPEPFSFTWNMQFEKPYNLSGNFVTSSVLLQILSYLDLPGRVVAKRVCPVWFRVLGTKSFWTMKDLLHLYCMQVNHKELYGLVYELQTLNLFKVFDGRQMRLVMSPANMTFEELGFKDGERLDLLNS